MQFRPEIVKLVDEVIAEFGDYDLDIRDEADRKASADEAASKSNYLNAHRHEYLRTVQDLTDHFGDRKDVRVFEIGAFFGVVCICLARLGYDVTASDVPEYMSMPEQEARFAKEGIAVHQMRLQDYVFDQEDGAYDAVIMCEVLEHLNFNPLPLIKEINRILSPSGVFYVALPNAASIYNRISLLRGRMIGLSVEGFFDQLDPKSVMIINDHWREYTAPEVRYMLERMGFDIAKQYYFSLGECQAAAGAAVGLRKKLARAFYKNFPQFKENQTTLAVKRVDTPLRFRIPATVHPTLREL
ncbi:MAG: class I SAM-dependent methyltransferase [Pseudomonadota bacterium]